MIQEEFKVLCTI